MADYLCVRMEGGTVWTCAVTGVVIDTGQTAEQFVDYLLYRHPTKPEIYLEGCKDNSDLFDKFMSTLDEVEFPLVYLCRPYTVGHAEALKRMWVDSLKAQPGRRFYPIGLTDLLHYSISLESLSSHPAYLARNFLPFGCDKALLALLQQITDPRWFINSNKPNRFNRVFRALKLTPEEFQLDFPALRSWYDPDATIEANDPQYFFYRYWSSLPTPYPEKVELKLLKTTKLFVEFVCRVWLDAHRKDRGQFGVFDPDAFFKRKPAIERFVRRQWALES